jgi:hypothetical protein
VNVMVMPKYEFRTVSKKKINCRSRISIDTNTFLKSSSDLSSGMYSRVKYVLISETSVDNYFTRPYIPEDKSELHTRHRENLKSHTFLK